MKIVKKWLALILAVCMALNGSVINVLAAEPGSVVEILDNETMQSESDQGEQTANTGNEMMHDAFDMDDERYDNDTVDTDDAVMPQESTEETQSDVIADSKIDEDQEEISEDNESADSDEVYPEDSENVSSDEVYSEESQESEYDIDRTTETSTDLDIDSLMSMDVNERLAQMTSEGDIASGVTGDIAWVINVDGKLIVVGSGEYIAEGDLTPWHDNCNDIISANINIRNINCLTSLFLDCSKLTSVDLSGLDMSKVTYMNKMFSGCECLKNIDLSMFDTDIVVSMSAMFKDCKNIENLNLKTFYTENVEGFDSMFYGCSSLQTLDLSNFRTDSAKNMNNMFRDCGALASLNVNEFNTINVTSMNRMFSGCSNLTEINVNNFNVSQVESMRYLFYACSKLQTIDFGSFDVSNVKQMDHMFDGCSMLTNLNLSGFDVKNAEQVSSLIEDCTALKTINTPKNLSLEIMLPQNENEVWKMPDGTVINVLPQNLDYSVEIRKYDESIINENDIAHGSYKDIVWSINADGKLTVIGSGNLHTVDFPDEDDYPWLSYRESIISAEINLTDPIFADYLFYNCSNLKEVNIINFNTDKLADMYGMFLGCDNLDKISVPAGLTETCWLPILEGAEIWIMPDGTEITYLPMNLSERTEIIKTSKVIKPGEDIASGVITWTIDADGKLTLEGNGDYKLVDACTPWYGYRTYIKSAKVNVANMKNMALLFQGCDNLENVDLSDLDTSKVTDMSGLFMDCVKLKDINFGNFDTSNVYDMMSMFSGCKSLVNLDLSIFDTGKVEDMSCMFYGCSSLENLDLHSFDTSNVSDMSSMFTMCRKLEQINISGFNTENVINMSFMFNACDELKNIDLSSFDTSNLDLVYAMFANCGSLESLDLSSFDLFKLNDLDHFDDENEVVGEMLIGCNMLRQIQTPKNLKMSVQLPAGRTWTMPDGAQITELPKNLSYSVEITCVTSEIDDSHIGNPSYEDPGDDTTYGIDKRIDLNSINGEISKIKAKTYDGTSYEPSVKVTVKENNKKKTLIEGTDYRVIYSNNTNAGTGIVTVRGNGIYKGELTKEFTINPKAIKKAKVTAGSLTVGESTSDIPIQVYDGNILLTRDIDYTLSYPADITSKAAKSVKVKVIAKEGSDYIGETTVKVAVYEATADKIINPENVTLANETMSYTGKAVKNTVTVKLGDTVLTNKQYKVQYQNNKNAGTAFIIVTGKGGYKGKVVKSFEITANTPAFEIKKISDKTYNGKLQKPSVTVKANGKKLKKNKDYTVFYKNNLHAGTATVTVIGKGNYSGRAEQTFTINKQKISKVSVKGTRKSGLTISYGKRTLQEGIDYTLNYGEIKKNKIKVTITATEKSDFKDSVIKTVKIG